MSNKVKYILAIETSCDETAASVVGVQKTKDNYEIEVLSNVVASQIEIHKKWGGVYPELASRAHLEAMIPVLDKTLTPLVRHPELDSGSRNSGLRIKSAMTAVDAIAITVGPGLIGSLLMGVEAAQILASYFDLPVIPVNHLEGHIYAAFVAQIQSANLKSQNKNLRFKIPKAGIFPAVALIVSGGHTSLILMDKHLSFRTIGQTIDDAAGEAFDKVARILNLGYPGGPAIEKLAKKGNENAYNLPLAMAKSGDLNFSFSGLKTAVLYLVKPPQKHSNILQNVGMNGKGRTVNGADLAASFQKTVAEILTQKTIQAVKKYRPKTVILSGGVSANQYLREYFVSGISKLKPETPTRHRCARPPSGLSRQAVAGRTQALAGGCHLKSTILVPPRELSTDNAVGIGIAGGIKFLENKSCDWPEIEANANLTI